MSGAGSRQREKLFPVTGTSVDLEAFAGMDWAAESGRSGIALSHFILCYIILHYYDCVTLYYM